MKLKLKNKTLSENKEVAYLTFESEEKISFQAGQFMMLDNGEIKRAYSIASSPLDEDISFYVKKASENGMSKYLVEDIQIGDNISFMGPFGHMILEESKNYLLISTWSGLAPILSIYRTLLKQWNYKKIVNLYWERYENTMVPAILEEMKSYENENVKNYFHLSREEKDWFWKWYVENSLEKAISFLWTDDLNVYICWKPVMVDETIEKLEKLWVKKENIKFEKF